MDSIISDEIIDYVSILAKLKLSDEEKKRVKADMESMLHHVEKLNILPTNDIEPMAQSSSINNVFREDKVSNPEDPLNTLMNAPNQKDGYFVTAKIL
jgi:aspartyl/glutamyl-tRNA(Asn/Gln) amidotransferase, C subunit